MDQDVTQDVQFGPVDDESLPLLRCVCGEQFKPWEQVISIYKDHPWVCPKCGAKLIFSNNVFVYKVP